MKEAIRSILLEFRERKLPEPLPRMILPPELPPNVRKAWVLMGMRRSGKTWTAYQEILKRQKRGLSKDSNLYINFEDDRLAGFEVKDFHL
jgi:predicted AAA+ superfamily ATPase